MSNTRWRVTHQVIKKTDDVLVPAIATNMAHIDMYRTDITYLRSLKDFEESDIIYAEVHSLNEKKHGEHYTLRNKCKAVAAILDKRAVILGARSVKVYCKDTNAVSLSDAIELIKKDKHYMDKLQRLANKQQAQEALRGIDENLEKYLNIIHPQAKELRETALGKEAYVDYEVFDIKPNLKVSREDIESLYKKWKKENFVIAQALRVVTNSMDYRYDYILGSTDPRSMEVQKQLDQITEMYQMSKLMKKQAPTTRRAVSRVNIGSRAQRNRINARYLAQ